MISYGLSNYNPNYLWMASLGFLINWFGDSLDGTLARYRHIERPRYGFYIDHVTDGVCQVMIFLGLGLTPYVSFNIARLALISYLLLSILVYVYVCGGRIQDILWQTGTHREPCSGCSTEYRYVFFRPAK